MKIDLNLSVDVNEQKIKEDIRKSTERSFQYLVERAFESDRHYGKAGSQFKLIREKVDSLFLTDDVQKHVDHLIETLWPDILKAAVTKALEQEAAKMVWPNVRARKAIKRDMPSGNGAL